MATSQGYLFIKDDGSIGGLSLPIVQVLARVSGINLKATGQTPLYTVPAGKTLVITSMPLKVTSVNTFATPATVRVGLSAAYTEYLAATALTGLSLLNGYTDLAAASLLPIHQTFSAGQVLTLDITVGAAATTMTGEIEVVGYIY